MALVEQVARALTDDVTEVVRAIGSRLERLASEERYEEAAEQRDNLRAFLRAGARTQRLLPLVTCPRVVAARRTESGRWEVVLARYGRLAGTATVPRGADPWSTIRALEESAEAVPRPGRLCGAATAEESDLIAAWLEEPGTRIVEADHPWTWAWPVAGAAASLAALPGAHSRAVSAG